MNRRKELSREYKERKLQGGVYKINNTVNGNYLIDTTTNLKGKQNQFEFALKTGSVYRPELRKDWEELGAQAFSLEILEEVEQREDQTEAQFMEELKTLQQLWLANFDASKKY